MIIKTRGIVFRTVKYSETSLIADIYTEARGLQQYYLNGVRSEKSRLKAGLLQVMSLVDLVAYARDDRHLNRVKELRPAYVYQSLPFEVHKGAIALFMAEIARKTIREAEPNELLFEFLFQTLTYLDRTAQPIGNLHLHFMLQLSGYLGFQPNGDWGPETPCFDLREGVFVPQEAPQPLLLDPALSESLYRLLESPLETCHEVPMNRAQRNHLLSSLLDYYRFHVEHLPEIHAHVILREVLG